MKSLKYLFCFLSFSFAASLAHASSGGVALADVDIADDQASLQRGFKEYYNICRMCHRLEFVKYQYLMDIGFDKAYVDALRGTRLVNEHIPATISPEIATKLFGAEPPDLSLMAKARKHGPRYIYTLLTSYYEKPDGSYDNKLFPAIKMPDPLAHSVASEARKKLEEEKIKDLVAFLTWSADPRAAERKSLGVWVLLYLFVLTGLFYAVKKRVWNRLPPPVSEALKNSR